MPNFIVTTSADVVNAGDGVISLREAVTLANAGAGADTIFFGAAVNGGVITLAGGELELTSDVTIDGDVNGDNKADVTISGNNASRIFNISGAGTDVDLNSLTLTNGKVNSFSGGGAILTGFDTTLDILDTTIRNSYAGLGGGIFSSGTLTATNSTISGNAANSYGGGVYVFSTVSSPQSAMFVNTTIAGNSSLVVGGGIDAHEASTVTIRNSTIAGNTTGELGGGGINLVNGAQAIVTNSVIALNTTLNDIRPDVSSTGFPSQLAASHSFFGTAIDTTSNNLSLVNNGGNIIAGSDPFLAALADNGGTVQTRNILANSVLINAGDNAAAAGITVDANGHARIVGEVVDIGAVETQILVVTTASDVVDANDGVLSLREAVTLANLNADANTVAFAAGLGGQTLFLTGGELALTADVTIDGDISGDNKADITISGNNVSQIFIVSSSGADVDLLSLTLANGKGNVGGAILTIGSTSLDIVDTTIRDSRADIGVGLGGAIASLGTLTVTNSIITGNYSNFNGGGVFVDSGQSATFVNTTIDGNSAAGFGGGIDTNVGASLIIRNSTITGNTAGSVGGGIDLRDGTTAAVTNSVIALNSAFTATSDISEIGTPSILTAAHSFFGGPVAIDIDNGGNINAGGNPLLGQLLDNGGTVLTRSPLDGSPLIGLGANASLPADSFDIDGDGNTAEPLPRDGRGGLRIVGANADAGAVEQIVNETIGGTAGNDLIVGSAGNDILDGRLGNDSLDGGTGNDIFVVDSAGDIVIEAIAGAPGGIDMVKTALASYTLGPNVEKLTFTGAGNHTGKGNGLNNTLNGNAGDDKFIADAGGSDVFSGGNGSDSMFFSNVGAAAINFLTGVHGGSAAGEIFASIEKFFGSNTQGDTMIAGAGRVVFSGQGGNDTLTGGANIDTLIGGTGNDTLTGGGGIDTLQGGKDADTMTGGAGKDYFVYTETAASGGWGADTVTDFQDGVDRIKIDAPGVASTIADFTITGNGTTSVLLTLNALPASTIALHGAAAITITAADFLFY